MKSECHDHFRYFTSLDQLGRANSAYMEFHNELRPHQGRGNPKPGRAEGSCRRQPEGRGAGCDAQPRHRSRLGTAAVSNRLRTLPESSRRLATSLLSRSRIKPASAKTFSSAGEQASARLPWASSSLCQGACIEQLKTPDSLV
jgi:hypothetical protein